MPGHHRPLDTYRAKRDPAKTPEPFGGGSADAAGDNAPLVFVVQQHAARRLHWDLRLEWGGVLLSWAVPQGPSRDPADKRLAVQTEDHPLDYAEFEGLIPKGEYGGGAMIVWDRGRWVPLLDPDEGFVTGKQLFELHGFKLRGVWTLVRIKKDPKSWLLIKEHDAWAASAKDGPVAPYDPASVLSGLTVEELAEGGGRSAEVTAVLGKEKLKAAPRAEEVKLMLAETRREPFNKAGWIFELKYDGYRVLAGKRQPTDGSGRVLLLTRAGNDATRTFPEIARAVAALPYGDILLDGEAVVLDENGRPDFGMLQKRGQLRRPADIERGALELPVTFFVFDLLAFEGKDLRSLPLTRRKELLQKLLPRTGTLRFADHVPERGADLFREARRLGVEGVMAKKDDAPYVAGRSAHWLKVRADHEDDFVVVGYTVAKGSRAGFGAIHLAQYEPGAPAAEGTARRAPTRPDGESGESAGMRLVYSGRAGSGFSDAQLTKFQKQLDAIQRKNPPCEGNPPKGKDQVWVDPEYVAVARFTERTHDGLLRHPVFVRLRDDKRPEECIRQAERGGDEPEESKSVSKESARGRSLTIPRSPRADSLPSAAERQDVAKAKPSIAQQRVVKFSNLNKVFWPEEGYTKGDLIEFYRRISPWLMPYLNDRPLVLDRYPDGIAGKNFYQKNAPAGTPDWVRTLPIWSDDSQRDIEYFVCNDVETLLHIANLGAIPLHIWASRVSDLAHPDWSILDLDPKGAPFTDVVAIALAARELCEEVGLPVYVKTSGSQGMHVLIPLGGQCTFEQGKQLGIILATMLARAMPKIATTERVIAARRGRVYIDALQNGEGKLLVAPFSVRPVPGARVSTPLTWKEVTPKLDATKFTIKNVVEKMEKAGDPLASVLNQRIDLGAALGKLISRGE